MPAIKPVGASVEWAKESTALKVNPPSKVVQYGWTTSNGLFSGTPERPALQYENGWRDNVYKWISYLEEKSDENVSVPTTGQSSDYFLKTNGSSVFSWSAIRQVPADSTTGYFLTMTSPTTYGWASVITNGQATATVATGAGSVTLSNVGNANQFIWYKVGSVVFFSSRLVVSSTSAPSGTLIMNGLPNSSVDATPVSIAIDYTGSSVMVQYAARINAGTSSIQIFSNDSGSLTSTIADQVIVSAAANITNISRTSNVATYTTSASHGYLVGAAVCITDITANVTFNGGYIITAVTLTTFSVAQAGSNTTLAATGQSRRTSVFWLSGQYLV
jgi:hypothetical protein